LQLCCKNFWFADTGKCKMNFFRISLIISMAFCFSLQAGTGAGIVTTIHPFKEILQKVVGDRMEVIQLLPAGASPHTYELRPSEIMKIEQARAVFYGAANLDGWVTKMQHAHLISLVDMIPDSLVLQISASVHFHSKNDRSNIDPHFWTDPLVVKAILPAICDTLSVLDPAGKNIYLKNMKAFRIELDKLNQEITNEERSLKGVSVFLSHPFFQYYLRRFGFKIAGIIEVNPGMEPTPRELKFFIDLSRKENVRAVLAQVQLSDRPAKLLAEAAHIVLIELDPLGGFPGRETYSELLLYNTNLLVKDLE
jgi:zinc transport system substrate-binding protein